MKTKRELERQAKRLFRLCLADGTLDEERARLVVKRVLESRPRGYLVLLAGFKRLLKSEYLRHIARVESALLLPAGLQSHVQSSLSTVYGPGLTCVYIQNPALIGGMRIQVGSDVYDGSVRSGLARLEKTLGITYTEKSRSRA
jgi:F-type H+-transporting ATPase subunit delta